MKHVMFCMSLESNMKMHQKMFLNAPPQKLKTRLSRRMSIKIDDQEFSVVLKNNFVFENKPHFGLCLSGGPDSLALFILVEKWITLNSGKLTVFHFNHNLRKESLSQAEELKLYLKKNVDCLVFNWKRKKNESEYE